MVGLDTISVAGLAAGGLALVLSLRGRWDHRYVGLPPGQLPQDGVAFDVERAPRPSVGEIPVCSTPPAGVSPGEAGVLLRRKVSPVDAIATLVDLELRGYLHIDRIADDWALTVGRAPDEQLRPHEKALLRALFPNTGTIWLSVSERLMTNVAEEVDAALARSAVERGWYRRIAAGRFPLGMILFTIFFGVFLGPVALGSLVFLMSPLGSDDAVLRGLLIAGVLGAAALLLRRRKGRMPAGYAAHQQVLGFRRYLETAGSREAERYLPWAIAFGLPAGGPARRLLRMG
jgi:hypothetical protein